MADTGILGAGTFGMALARMLANKGLSVNVWTRHSEKLDKYDKERVYPGLSGMDIPESICFIKELGRIVSESRLLVFAVPSIYVRETAAGAAPFVSDGQIIACVAKGMEKNTLLSMTEVIKDEIPCCRAVALSGPTHAEEVARDLPSTIVSSSRDMEAARVVQDVFMNTCMRVYTNPDIKGVELCGALKNIMALATGMSEGLGYGDNSKAALITRGLAEMVRLGLAMGCRPGTFAGLSGIGDLVVTATSKNSRNNRAGILMGKGLPAKEAVKEVGMVVEGVNALPAALELAQKYGVDMPITFAVDRVVNHGANPKDAVSVLMNRDKKDETDM